ncbi:MAG TPA: lysozyme inhibitor LprI family protein [Verrucomicrobiae bacterium]|nr:lysozyme inhibitor LprI family protein [Verrucomicrobiae bacterium]
MRKSIGIAVFVLLAGTACFGQAKAGPKDCMDVANTQAELNACAAQKAATSEDELNSAYRSALAKVKGDVAGTERVRLMEREWVAYREAYLAAKFPPQSRTQSGSIFPMNFSLAKASLTECQVSALKDLFANDNNPTP